MANIKDLFVRIVDSIFDRVFISMTIFILGIVQLFYKFVPDGWFLSLQLACVAVFIYNNIDSPKKQLYEILSVIYIVVGYAMHLLVPYEYVLNNNYAILVIFYAFVIVNYLFAKDDFESEYKSRVINILISQVYMAVLYFGLYIVVNLINEIFDLGINTYMGWFGMGYNDETGVLFRVCNAVAVVVGLLIFTNYEKKSEYKNSKFFTIMFKVIMPYLLIVIGIANLILKIKSFDSSTDDFWFETAIWTIAVGATILLGILEDNTKKQKIIYSLLSLYPITWIYNLYRHVYKGNIGDKDNFSFIYNSIVFLILGVYFGYCTIKSKKCDYKIKHIALLCVLIYGMPIIGFANVDQFQHLNKEEISKKIAYKNEKTNFESFYIKKTNRNDIVIDNNDILEFKYIKRVEDRDMSYDRKLDVTGYNTVYYDLSNYNSSSIKIDDLEVYFENNSVDFVVKLGDIKDVYNLHEIVLKYCSDNNLVDNHEYKEKLPNYKIYNDIKPIEIIRDKYKIVIYSYRYQDSPNYKSVDVRYHILVK